MNNPLVFL